MNKTLNEEELLLTQLIQRHFPGGMICPELLRAWLSCPPKLLTERLQLLLASQPHERGPLYELLNCSFVSWTRPPLSPKTAFALNNKDNAVPFITFASDDVKQWFFGMEEVPPPGTTTLYSYGLTRTATNRVVVEKLGGVAKARAKLTFLYALLERQPKGEVRGVLSVGTARNVFCIEDANNIPRIVIAQWLLGWSLMAGTLESLCCLHKDDRIFSPVLLMGESRT